MKMQQTHKQAWRHVMSVDEASALAFIATCKDQKLRAELLAAIAPRLSEQSLEQSLLLTRTLRNTDARAIAIAGLAPSLPGPLLLQALVATRLLADDWAQEDALLYLARFASPQMQRRILDRIWPTPRYCTLASALTDLVPHLDASLQNEALTRVQMLEHSDSRQAALAALAPQFPAAEQAMLKELQQITQPKARKQALLRMMAYLPAQVRVEALRIVSQLGNSDQRVKMLLRLAPQLPDSYHNEVFQIAYSIGKPLTRATAVVTLILALSTTVLTVRAATQQICDAFILRKRSSLPRLYRQQVSHEILAALVQRYVGQLTIDQALQLVQQLPDKLLMTAMVKLVGYLSLQLVYDALDQQIFDATAWPNIHAALLVRLAVLGYPEKSLQRVHTVTNDAVRVEALTALARVVPLALLDEVLTISRSWYTDKRVPVIIAVLPRLVSKPRDELYPYYIEALTLLATNPRRTVLTSIASLAPLIKELGGQDAIDESLVAIEEVCSWFP